MAESKESQKIAALEVRVECPHCTELQEGFVGDPRGGSFTCDSCGEPYTVAHEALFEVW